MTPAEELAAAADKLDALASSATPDMGAFDDIEDVLFPEDLAYIAAMNPLVGADLVVLLREFAAHVERRWRDFHEMWNTEQRVRMIGDYAPGLHAMLRIARLINGNAVADR